LIGTDPSKLPPALTRLMAGQWKKGAIPPKWDGKAAERMVESLEVLLQNNEKPFTNEIRTRQK
jgi:UDP-N-acetylglucosamine 2-epimerase (non-hydrolysing)